MYYVKKYAILLIILTMIFFGGNAMATYVQKVELNNKIEETLNDKQKVIV